MLPRELAEYVDNQMWKDLLVWRDFLFVKLLLSTKWVAIGLVMEGPELVWEIVSMIRHAIFKLRFHFLLPEKPTPSLVKVVAFIGWFLIAAGVGGEWYLELLIKDQDAAIQSVIDIRVENAKNAAALAILQASINGMESSRLEKDAEDERFARVRLQQDIEPRRLSKSEQIALSATLSQSPAMTTLIEYGSGNTEAYAFGFDIASALSLAHWQPSDPHGVLRLSSGPFAFNANPHLTTGVTIESCPNDESRKAETALRDGLIALGFDATSLPDNCAWVQSLGQQNAAVKNPRGLHVFIEPRPEGPQGKAKLRHEQVNSAQPK